MAQAKDLQLNGWKWNLAQQLVWQPKSKVGLVAEDLDFAGAELHKLRGRGPVRLSHDRDGLVIFFDDPQGGADTYEVIVNFAEAITPEGASSTKGLRWEIKARVEDSEDILFSQDQAVWTHYGESPPATSRSMDVRGTSSISQRWNLTRW